MSDRQAAWLAKVDRNPCCGGDVAEQYEHATGCDQTGAQSRVFVQWKGSNVCIDFRCTCGEAGHYDGLFAYNLHCTKCGQVWEMPASFMLNPISPDGCGVMQDMDFDCNRPD